MIVRADATGICLKTLAPLSLGLSDVFYDVIKDVYRMNNFMIGLRRLIYGFQQQTRETIWKHMNDLAMKENIYSKELKDFCPEVANDRLFVYASNHNIVVVLLDTSGKDEETDPEERVKAVLRIMEERLENSNHHASLLGVVLTGKTIKRPPLSPLAEEFAKTKVFDRMRNLKRHKVRLYVDHTPYGKVLVEDATNPDNDPHVSEDNGIDEELKDNYSTDYEDSDDSFEAMLKKFIDDEFEKVDDKNDEDGEDSDSDMNDVVTENSIEQNLNLSVKVKILQPIPNPRKELDKLVGCEDIKRRMDELVALTQYNKMMREMFPASKQHEVSLHSVFLGRPGTGKTTVCKIFGSLLHQAGALSKGHVVMCDRGTFIGTLWGDEERSMNQVLEMAKGGVLMIDEACLLNSKHEADPGKLVIQLLMNILADEKQRDIAVVLCGYKEPMQKLLDSNPGLQSRFPNKFEFTDFSIEELLEITRRRVREYEYEFTPEAWDKYREVLAQAYQQRDPQTWGNARFIGNLLERIYVMHAKRCVREQPTEKGLLRMLTPEDICEIEVPKPRPSIGFAIGR